MKVYLDMRRNLKNFVSGNLLNWLTITSFLNYFLPKNPLISLLAIVTLSTLPGLAILVKLRISVERNFQTLFYSVLFSILYIQLASMIAQLLAYKFGWKSPLSPFPTFFFSIISILVSARIVNSSRGPREAFAYNKTYLVNVVRINIFPTIIPLLSLFGVMRLNNRDDQVSTRIILYAILGIYISIFLLKFPIRVKSLTPNLYYSLFCLNLAILIQTSFRGDVLWGFDINSEFAVAKRTLDQHFWTPPSSGSEYYAMLSLTVLPTVLALFSKLGLITIFHIFYPAIAALIPIAIYDFLKKFVSHRIAFFVMFTLLISSISFIPEMPALCRQCIGLAFFAGMIVAIFKKELTVRKRRSLFLLCGLGLSCSHYSSAYLAAFLFFFAGLINLRLNRKLPQSEKTVTFLIGLAFLCTVTLYNGVFTHSLQDTKAQYQQLQQQGAKLLPQKQGNFINRWLNGVKNVQDVRPSSYKVQVVGQDLSTHPELKTPLVGLAYEVTSGAFPNTEYELGRNFGVGLVWMYIASNTALQIMTVSSLIFFIMLVRFGFPKRARSKIEDEGLEWQWIYSDALSLLIVALGMAVYLRISGTIGSFYNPQRAAFQLNFLFALPMVLTLWSLLKIFPKLRIFFLSVSVCAMVVIFSQASGLATYFTGNTSSRISNAQGDSYPFVSTIDQVSVADFIAAHVDPMKTPINADAHSALTLYRDYRINQKNVFTQIAPFGLFENSYVLVSNSNIRTGIAEGINLKVTNGLIDYLVPFDYYEKYLNVVYSSSSTIVYH